MMLVPLFLIVQCLHADTLGDQLYPKPHGSTKPDLNIKAVHSSLEQSLGYSKSYVLLQGPKLQNIHNDASNKQSIISNRKEENNLTSLDTQKEDDHLKSGENKADHFSFEQPLEHSKPHVILQGPRMPKIWNASINIQPIVSPQKVKNSTLMNTNKEDDHSNSDDLRVDNFSLEQQLGYSKSHVILQGPRMPKIWNASINIQPILSPQKVKNSTLLNTNKEDDHSNSDDLRVDHFNLEQQLGYSKSHVILQGPRMPNIWNASINIQPIVSQGENNSKLLDAKKEDDHFKFDILSKYNHDTELHYHHAYLLSKMPSSLLRALPESQLKKYDTKEFNFDNRSPTFEHETNISLSERHIKKIVNERSISIQKTKPLKDSSHNLPVNSYASASSWAGSYGRPSVGGTTANAQASASAGGSSASSSSGSSSGSVHNGGSGSNAGSTYQSTSGFGTETNGGSTELSNSGAYFNNYYKPTGPIGGGGSSGPFVGSTYLTGSGTLGGSTTSLDPGTNSGSTSSSGTGSYYSNYYRPSQNTGLSAGSSSLNGSGSFGGLPSQILGGYHRPSGSNAGIYGTGSSSGGSSFSVGGGFNNVGSTTQPGSYYGVYKPSSLISGGTSGSSATIGEATVSSGLIEHQGNYHRPTGVYSAGSGVYQGSLNRPFSSSFSGSTSSAGGGGYYNYNKPTASSTGNYSPYNRPTTSGSHNNYYKPPSNSGTSTPSSAGYGSYYGTYNKPNFPSASQNHQNTNNKPSLETTSKPTGAYYNGYFITTSPNSGTNIDGIAINTFSNGGSKPLTGTGTATSSFSGSTSGSSSGIGIISGPIINSGTSTSSIGSIGSLLYIPWWLEAGVFSSAAITGSHQGVNSVSGISSNLVTGINNFGSGSPMVFETGGVTNVSTSEAGNQDGRPPPGFIFGAGSASSSLVGTDIHGVRPPTGTLLGTENIGGSTSGYQTHEGGGSAGNINSNLGSVSISGTEDQSNSSSISPTGSGYPSGSIQGLESSSGAIMGFMQPVNNPGLTPEVTTITSLINSGISLTLPWWFLTGVFSGSVDHSITSQTGSSGVVGTAELTGITSAGSSGGSTITPGWSGIASGSGLEPVTQLGSTLSGDNIGLQTLQSLQSNAETSVGVASNFNGPTSPTGIHSENQSLGNLPSGSPLGIPLTAEILSGSHPEISSGNNIDSSSGLIIGPTIPGNLPISLGATQVEGLPSNSQSGISPLDNFSIGPGDHAIGVQLVNSSHHGFEGYSQGSSGLATTITSQDNAPIGPQLGQSQTGETSQQVRPSAGNSQVSPQQGAFPDIIFPSSSRPGLLSVSDIAVTSRPQGWSGENNGPASVIGFQSRPTFGSVAEAGKFPSSGASTSNSQFPYKVSEGENADKGIISVSQPPWWLLEDEKSPESSKRYHTAFSDRLASGSEKDKTTITSKKSKDIVQITSNTNRKATEKEQSNNMRTSSEKGVAKKQ